MIITPIRTLKEDLPQDIRHYAFHQHKGKLPLTPGKRYVVSGIRYIPPHKYYLIIDDDNELRAYPWWFPAELFKVVDDSIPPDWVTSRQEGYSIQSFPEIANDESGMFENNLDDGDPEEMKVFLKYYEQYARKHGLWYVDGKPEKVGT